MPQLGETVTEGTVTRWLKQVGEQVAPDELIFEVSTDKVDSEVPSPGGGYLAEILVPEGETVPVGTRLAVLTEAPPGEASGGDGDGAQATAEAPAPVEADAPAEARAEAPAEATAEAPAEATAEAPAQAEADAPAEAEAEAPAEAEAQAEASAPVAEAAPAPTPEPEAETAAAGNGNGGAAGMLLSPVVRRLIAEHDLNPTDIPGTGEGGRITRSDVLAYIDKRSGGARPAEAPGAQAPAPAPPAAAPAPEAPAAAPAPETAPAAAPAAEAPAPAPTPSARATGDEVIPFDNIRRRTAEHMVRSKATSPHVLTAVEVDFDAVERARAEAKDDWKAKEGFSLTYLPFIARAVCDALAEYPRLNASVDGESLVVHRAVNLGIAVDLGEKGLIVPVIKAAEGKRLRQLAREVRVLAERARNKKLTPDDVTGGTYTITNPGPFGTLISAPVINQPQVAILSTDGIRKRPVVVETPSGDAIAIHPVGILAMQWDHRANDGAYAAAFLNRLREIIETRDWSPELA